MEHFEEDLVRFERWCDVIGLGRNVPWGPWDRLARWGAHVDALRAPRANRTRRKPAVSVKVDGEVSEILQEEMELYGRARARRNADVAGDASAGPVTYRGSPP